MNGPNFTPQLDWPQLRQLSTPPKLVELWPEAHHLFDFYYRVGEAEYAFAAPHWNDDYSENAVYVDALYWAPSIAAFRRMVSREIESAENDDAAECPLPQGLRLAPNCLNFGTITQFASDNPRFNARIVELYGSKDWVRTGCCYALERLTYYFRTSPPVPINEFPYAAKLSIRDDLWNVAVKT